MDFLFKPIKFNVYYFIFHNLYKTIGFNYFKSLNKLYPPIRIISITDSEEMVSLVYPNDFIRFKDLLEKFYIQSFNETSKFKICDKEKEIYEIYPSLSDLTESPNAFVGLFVNKYSINIVKSEFHENNEISDILFLEVTNSGIDISNLKLSGVIGSFIYKFNKRQSLINKYIGLYLVVGKLKKIDIITGKIKDTNKYNIIGGKRKYNEKTIDGLIREVKEELGLYNESKLYKLISILIPITKDIIKCHTFKVFCIYFTPKSNHNYDLFINKSLKLPENILTI